MGGDQQVQYSAITQHSDNINYKIRKNAASRFSAHDMIRFSGNAGISSVCDDEKGMPDILLRVSPLMFLSLSFMFGWPIE